MTRILILIVKLLLLEQPKSVGGNVLLGNEFMPLELLLRLCELPRLTSENVRQLLVLNLLALYRLVLVFRKSFALLRKDLLVELGLFEIVWLAACVAASISACCACTYFRVRS